ncbi:hypothetical protein [Kitasatospora sp. NPDC056181]|uniref:hypothetical protein n=1 Tax=Kitasatospora sp. NPDC056181 TaxID=3345737 RepID=UPI0035D647A8
MKGLAARLFTGWDLLILLGSIAIAVQGYRHGASLQQAALHGLSPLVLGMGALRVFSSSTSSKTTTATGRKGGKK